MTVLGSSLDAVYHVTIAYSSTFGDSSTGVERLPAPSMSDILMGKNPRVHVHLRRIAAAGKGQREEARVEEPICWEGSERDGGE